VFPNTGPGDPQLSHLTHLIQIIISLIKSSELNWVCQIKETYKMCRAVGPQDQDWETQNCGYWLQEKLFIEFNKLELSNN